MTTLDTITEFIGWCSVINIGMLMLTSILVLLLRTRMSQIHGKMFGMSTTDVSKAYFQYLAQYKITVIVLNLVPYIALKIMA